jgi:hypothetical protein
MSPEDRERLLAAIRADIERLQKEVCRLQDLEAYLLERAGPPPAGIPPPPPAPPEPPDPAEAAERILREGAPRTIREITDLLLAGGYPVAGPPGERRRTLANTLHAAMLKATDRFHRVRKGVWELAAADPARVNGSHAGKKPRSPPGGTRSR